MTYVHIGTVPLTKQLIVIHPMMWKSFMEIISAETNETLTSEKYNSRNFEFGSHNLKEHHEIPLNGQNQ